MGNLSRRWLAICDVPRPRELHLDRFGYLLQAVTADREALQHAGFDQKDGPLVDNMGAQVERVAPGYGMSANLNQRSNADRVRLMHQPNVAPLFPFFHGLAERR